MQTLLQWTLFLAIVAASTAFGIAMARARSAGLRHSMWPRPPRAYPPVRERETLWRIAQSLPQMPGDSTVERIFTCSDTGYCLVLLLLDVPASVADLRRFRDELVRTGWSDKGFTGGRYHFHRSDGVLTVKPGTLAVGAELRICRNPKP